MNDPSHTTAPDIENQLHKLVDVERVEVDVGKASYNSATGKLTHQPLTQTLAAWISIPVEVGPDDEMLRAQIPDTTLSFEFGHGVDVDGTGCDDHHRLATAR